MEDQSKLAAITSQIVAAYVAKNTTSPTDIPDLIGTVAQALRKVAEPEAEAPAAIKLTAAQIRKSIRPEALTSFEDGRSYRTLKRHLTKRGMTVADYRAKWGLPRNYPTTAPAYSAMRSSMAKALGLGRKATTAPPVPKAKPAAVPTAKRKTAVRKVAKTAPKARKPRGRPKKAVPERS